MNGTKLLCSHPFGCDREIDPNGKIYRWADARGVEHLLCETHARDEGLLPREPRKIGLVHCPNIHGVFDLPGGGTARVSWGKGIRKNTATSYVAVFEGEEVGERAPWIEKWGSDIAGRESGRSRIFHAKIGVGAIDKALAYVESIGGKCSE